MIASLFSLMCALLFPAPAKEDRLSLHAHFDKETYKLGDAVVLHLTFKNNGRELLYLTGNHLFPDALEVGPGRYFELRIFDDKGARLHYWGENLSEGGTYWQVVPVEAGRSYKTECKLTAGSYATVAEDRRHKLGIDSKKYRVSVHYSAPLGTGGVQKPPKDFDEKRRWQGKLESNELLLQFK
jgi:hypothetical protein